MKQKQTTYFTDGVDVFVVEPGVVLRNVTTQETVTATRSGDRLEGYTAIVLLSPEVRPAGKTKRSYKRRVTGVSQPASESKEKSQYKGVLFTKATGRWRAVFSYQKKKYDLGYFDTEIDAAKALYTKRQEVGAPENFPEPQ